MAKPLTPFKTPEDERERRIAIITKGLRDGKDLTVIGNELGITDGRVGQLIKEYGIQNLVGSPQKSKITKAEVQRRLTAIKIGLDAGKTKAEIGADLGLSASRITQLINEQKGGEKTYRSTLPVPVSLATNGQERKVRRAKLDGPIVDGVLVAQWENGMFLVRIPRFGTVLGPRVTITPIGIGDKEE